MPNIRILAQVVFQDIVSTSFSIATMAEPKKGHIFAILSPTEKKSVLRIFCATYKISRLYTNWFPRYSRHLIFTKWGITLAIFDALYLKVSQHIFI